MEFVKLRAFAIQRKDLRHQLQDDRGLQFFKHCQKILESDNKNRINHWAGELWDLCEWILYIQNKVEFKITKQFIKDHYFCWGDDIFSFKPGLRNIREQKGEPLDNDTDQIKFDAYWRFADVVADELYNKTLTENKLKSLVNQYLVNIGGY